MAKSVLIVDDEREFAEALARRLALRGYAARALTSAEEALASAQAEPPDVVLLDLKMPGVRPMELLMTIRHVAPAVRVILLTGHLDHELRLEGMRLDSFPYLMKPVAMDELLARLEEAPAPPGAGR